jgi:hypothetical protein
MVDWHWDHRAGRRVPSSRRARVVQIVAPATNVVVWVVALALWGWGVVELVTGSYYGGGALVFAGGLLLIIWAGGGFKAYRGALYEWLEGPG